MLAISKHSHAIASVGQNTTTVGLKVTWRLAKAEYGILLQPKRAERVCTAVSRLHGSSKAAAEALHVNTNILKHTLNSEEVGEHLAVRGYCSSLSLIKPLTLLWLRCLLTSLQPILSTHFSQSSLVALNSGGWGGHCVRLKLIWIPADCQGC